MLRTLFFKFIFRIYSYLCRLVATNKPTRADLFPSRISSMCIRNETKKIIGNRVRSDLEIDHRHYFKIYSESIYVLGIMETSDPITI